MASIEIHDYTGESVLRENGAPWPFAIAIDETTVFADHHAELVAALDLGYTEIPESDVEGRLLRRYEIAVTMAGLRQEELLALAQQEHGERLGELVSEAQLNVLLQPKSFTPPFEGHWECEVALLGIATDFSPYINGIKRPGGNVVLVDPYTEITLLETLAQAGVLAYYVNPDGVAALAQE